MTKFKEGDRVEVKITGDVSGWLSDSNGTLLALDGGSVMIDTQTPGIQVRKLPPRKPEVGEVIDGARLKATPWKRGTVVIGTITDEDGPARWRLMLTGKGEWVEDSGDTFSFYGVNILFDDFEIAYLP